MQKERFRLGALHVDTSGDDKASTDPYQRYQGLHIAVSKLDCQGPLPDRMDHIVKADVDVGVHSFYFQ
jgi:hypothetical protein